MGRFRGPLGLSLKTSLSAKSLIWISVFIHIGTGTNYQNKNFALRLALKERLRGTRKWSIEGGGHENSFQLKTRRTRFAANVQGKSVFFFPRESR